MLCRSACQQLKMLCGKEFATMPPVNKKLLSRVMSELAKSGAKKRLAKISPRKRKAIAKKAAKARWSK